MDKKLTINYTEYASLSEMTPEDQELVNASVEACKSSYSPYSGFRVGAALRLANGVIVKGSNQENAAFPSGLCAERTAMFSANVNYHGVPQVAIAITAQFENGEITPMPASPCGACRQVMAEYQKLSGGNMSVILHGERVTYKFDKVDDILPFIFDTI